MIRSGAVLVGLALLALLAAIVVGNGQGASWFIACSVALCVAGVALLVAAPWPTARRPLAVQLVDEHDERTVLARELLDALDAAHADRADRG